MQKKSFSFITFDEYLNKIEIINNSQSMKSQRQTDKCIDEFQELLYSLQSYRHNASILKLKIYEYTKNIHDRIECKQNSAVMVCLYFIGMDLIGWDINQLEGEIREKVQAELKIMKKQIQIRRKQQFICQISAIVTDFDKEKAKKEFLLGFNKMWKLITNQCYKEDAILWKLITFYQFLFIIPLQNDPIQQNQVNPMAAFRKFLQKQQKYILISPKTQISTQNVKNFCQKNKKILRNRSIPTMKPNFSIRQLMIMQINNETIDLIDRCQTYLRPFIIFLIPFNYLLAQTFTYYTHFTSLYSFQIFSIICQQLHAIANSSNPQLDPDQIEKHLTYQINLKGSSSQEYRHKLGQFLKKYEEKMSNFIPVFYQIFAFHAFEKHIFVNKVYEQHKNVGESRRLIKERIKLLYKQCKRDYFEDV